MNKKRLSVVMAGAMLATSIAPVLAAETTVTTSEYTVGQKELLKKYLNDKLAEKEFTNNSVLVANNAAAQKYLGTAVAGELAGFGKDAYKRSVYEIKINGTTASSSNTIDDLVDALDAGQKVEIYEKENTTFLGQVIPAKEAPKALEENTTLKYTDTELTPGTSSTNFGNTTDGLIKDLNANRFILEDGSTCTEVGKATIKLKALTDINNTNSNIKLDIKTGDVKYDLNLPVDASGNLLDISKTNDTSENDLQKCVSFLKESNWTDAYATSADHKKVETINITEATPVEEVVTYKASDIYDGTLITEKGTELLNDIKNHVKLPNAVTNNYDDYSVYIDENLPSAVNGTTTLTVTYKTKKGTISKKVLIKSNVRKEIATIYNMLKNGTYNVGIVAGQNRYETAVNVAKESGVSTLSTSGLNNVVLVNGESLVDGLAAAPLSAKLKNGTTSAPLLLTQTDKLPTATKEYLEKLVENVPVKDLNQITVNLVGGRSVLSEELVKELKGMGFNVVRYGGDNREETSLKVASAVGASESFVVGANGEADAMSISAVAADQTTPKAIVVSSVHGLTDEAVDYLAKQKGNATILGGTSAISEAEEAKIKEAKENTTYGTFRIAGANRTETNEKILKKYATTLASKKVTLVKNGMNNKTELVDALSAANLGGPIVLVGSELSEGQTNTLLNATAPNTSSKLLQVGLGLNDSIIKGLSKTLNIINNDTI